MIKPLIPSQRRFLISLQNKLKHHVVLYDELTVVCTNSTCPLSKLYEWIVNTIFDNEYDDTSSVLFIVNDIKNHKELEIKGSNIRIKYEIEFLRGNRIKTGNCRFIECTN